MRPGWPILPFWSAQPASIRHVCRHMGPTHQSNPCVDNFVSITGTWDRSAAASHQALSTRGRCHVGLWHHDRLLQQIMTNKAPGSGRCAARNPRRVHADFASHFTRSSVRRVRSLWTSRPNRPRPLHPRRRTRRRATKYMLVACSRDHKSDHAATLFPAHLRISKPPQGKQWEGGGKAEHHRRNRPSVITVHLGQNVRSGKLCQGLRTSSCGIPGPWAAKARWISRRWLNPPRATHSPRSDLYASSLPVRTLPLRSPCLALYDSHFRLEYKALLDGVAELRPSLRCLWAGGAAVLGWREVGASLRRWSSVQRPWFGAGRIL
jgi:hypothetical protein